MYQCPLDTQIVSNTLIIDTHLFSGNYAKCSQIPKWCKKIRFFHLKHEIVRDVIKWFEFSKISNWSLNIAMKNIKTEITL